MSRRLFANLGFLLQISGLLTIFPIVLGLVFEETQAVISLFLACVTFLGAGFLLNALCERKELDFKGSNFLFLAAFTLIPLIGALPYFYMNPFGSANVVDRFTNGYFESISGFTTTGFSFIVNSDALPKSILIYRSLTELMGGVGVVFLLLAFFQSKKSLSNLSNSVGFDDVAGNLKKTYLSVFAIYSFFILIFTGIFYALGLTNLINTGTYVIDTLTGGFTPGPIEYQQYLSLAPKIFTMILMFVGGLNFAFIYNLFTRKLRNWASLEFIMFILIIVVGTISISVSTQVSGFDSLFHVISMSSSVGQSYLPLSSFGNTGFSILLITMLIGGCSFSMAGGIRVARIIEFAKNVKVSIRDVLVREGESVRSVKNSDSSENYYSRSVAVSILLFLIVLAVFAIIFTGIGVSFNDALFEVGSALTTNGISMGATTITMGVGYKWLMIVSMIIGRVEILSILVALFSIGKGGVKKSKSSEQ